MNAPTLSLITITKDDPGGLARTLASTAPWRGLPWVEQLVVDASAVPAQVDDSRIHVIRQLSTGISGAFNTGMRAATGEWIWFLNGGDCADERLTTEFLRQLLRQSRADVVIGGLTYEGRAEPHPHLPTGMQWPPLHSWIPHPSTLVRRRLFEQFGPFDGRYSIAMDYEWWLRTLSTQVVVDVLSAPFAVFAPGGVSQRPELQRKIAQERADGIRRHQVSLWRAWFSSGYRLVRVWLAAWFARRLK